MRKRLVGLGAAAVVMMPSKVDTREWVKKEAASSKVSMDVMAQGNMVAAKFAKAKSVEEFQAAEAIWIALRPNLAKYETSLSCRDYGASHDNDIAVDLAEELVKKPLGLMVDVGKLLLSLAAVEKDDSIEALKSAVKDLIILKTEKTLDDVRARSKIIERFKEALIKFLQIYSKRSRNHFLQVISDISSVAQAYGGLALKMAVLALTPSRINPDECGSEAMIEHERNAALIRVYHWMQSKGSAT